MIRESNLTLLFVEKKFNVNINFLIEKLAKIKSKIFKINATYIMTTSN